MFPLIVAGLLVVSGSAGSAQPPLPPLTIEVSGRPGAQVECTSVSLLVRERFPQRDRSAFLQVELSFRLPQSGLGAVLVDRPLVQRALDENGKALRLLGANIRPRKRPRAGMPPLVAQEVVQGRHPRPRPRGMRVEPKEAQLSAATQFSLPLPLPLPDELSLVKLRVPLRTLRLAGRSASGQAAALTVRLRHVPVPRPN